MAAPTISSITPITGKGGEQLVVIAGTNFDSVYQVKFVGADADSWTRDSAIQITALAPKAGGLDGVITVVNTDGEVSSGDTFTFTDPTTLTNDFKFLTTGDVGIFKFETLPADGAFKFATLPNFGIFKIETLDSDGVFKFKTQPPFGIFKITTLDVSVVYVADLDIAFDTKTRIATITDITTWGSNGKPARPTLLVMTMIETISGDIITLTPDGIPESVVSWETTALNDGIYRISLLDGASVVQTSLVYSVNLLAESVQNAMDNDLTEQIKCNRFQYSDVEIWHMRAMNEGVIEASESGLVTEATIILKESQQYAKKCNLKYKLNAC